GASVLQVANNPSAADLITNTLIGGNCYNISNVSYSGQGGQIGTFSNGSTNIGFANGMLIATGDISVAPGPNDQDNASAGYGIGTPDPDLSNLTGGSIVDKADIEFDFTPTVSQVSFDYVFASEEYCEYVNSQFNDVFGFFISGPGIVGTKNLAVIGTNTPVSINTINHLTNSGLYVHNTPFFGTNCGILPSFGVAVNEVQYDGFTKKLTATVNVIPCQTYHIKLKIADVGDGIFDSGVFLRANSFAAGGSGTVETVYPTGQSFAYEGCETGYVRFVRNSGDLSQPLTINFTIGATSTATSGVDYAPLTSPAIIPAGQTELLVPVNVLSDLIPEGLESIVLLVSNSCSCSQSQVNFLIQDKPNLSVSLPIQTICSGSSVTLTPGITGVGPFSYQWSTGATTPSIIVSPSVNTNYSVTVSDICGSTAATIGQILVLPAVQTMQTLSFCPGDSVVLNGIAYHSSDTIVQVSPGNNGACDTLSTYILQLLPQPVINDTISFCSGTTVTIGGVVYSGSGIVLDTLPGTNGACDTLATYVLQAVAQAVINDTIMFCAGTTITIGGVAYTGSGTVLDTLPGANGACDTLATYILQLLPQFVIQDTIVFCSGDTINLGGVNYTAAGVVQDT
ncbi:MAG: choice-of-anchor L domain-containing protein, partial [Saprospiraceae bacterium]